jgi:hypothetical protein
MLMGFVIWSSCFAYRNDNSLYKNRNKIQGPVIGCFGIKKYAKTVDIYFAEKYAKGAA